MTLFKMAGKKWQPFTIFAQTIIHLVCPQILHNHSFQFLLGITIFPREIEDNDYENLGGLNKLHYGLSGNGV